MPTIFQFKTFLTYWLDALDRHSLHSPFFYNLFTKVIQTKAAGNNQFFIEALRQKLLHCDDHIIVEDLGAGSQTLKNNKRSIGRIAGTSLTPTKYSALYYRIIDFFQCKNIIELGTSLGINTLYLADHPEAQVITFEGASAIAAVARKNFAEAGAHNITVIEGNIDSTLPEQLRSIDGVDFAFLDANHQYAPTLKYFEHLVQRSHVRTVMVVDDIHYTAEMENAWDTLKKHDRVHASADLYRCGILFFDPSLNKQHVVLQF